jgi:hypothetical protein
VDADHNEFLRHHFGQCRRNDITQDQNGTRTKTENKKGEELFMWADLANLGCKPDEKSYKGTTKKKL